MACGSEEGPKPTFDLRLDVANPWQQETFAV